MRILLSVVAWAIYMALVLSVIVCDVIAAQFWLGDAPATLAVLAAHELSLPAAALLIIPVMIRWKLKQVSWGTFAVVAMFIGIGSALMAIDMGFVQRSEYLAWLFALLAVASLVLFVYFARRNFQNMAALLRSRRRAS